MGYLSNRLWWEAAATRAVKTFAQTALAAAGTNAVSVTELDWPVILGLATTSAVLSMLTSLAGLPEVDGGGSDG